MALDMRSVLQRLKIHLGGATAIEYAMIAFFISIAGFSAILTIGSNVTSVFSQVASSF
jgi:Flp pilus assembly pilin Flp